MICIAKINSLGYIFIADSIFNHFEISSPKATKFGEITQNNGHYALRSFTVTDFGTSRKPICNFLLVIDNNIHPEPENVLF